ncbi:hypothetical protein [Microbispora catharanthi]|uniref:hypothetical protein n=1 Tax=Microbispora catharanthi TaxID=1712871 RepID=UPI00197BCFD2|nr:hypothetical protein [Microbispora catharanthi]
MSPSVSATRAGLPQLIVLLAGSCMPVLGAVLLFPVLPRMSEHFAATPGAAVLVRGRPDRSRAVRPHRVY